MPEKIWLKYDSEIKVYYRTFTADPNGNWFVFDSDEPLRDDVFLYDSEIQTDSDNVYVLYDSDLHSGLGNRYSQTITNEVRPLGFNETWVPENEALAAPFVNYDYTKEGQVGIPLPEEIIGIAKVFRIDNFSGMGMWNYEYQYFLNNFDFFYGAGGSAPGMITNYFVTKSYMELIDHVMNVQPAVRFNKHKNKLFIDTSWTRLKKSAQSKDHYLLVECYEITDPEVFGNVYSDSWLKRYATSLAKMQWGSNLKKYENVELPGGTMLSGQALYDEGKEEATKLEEELLTTTLEMDSILLG